MPERDYKIRESSLRRAAARQHLKPSKGGRRAKPGAGGYELRDSDGAPLCGHDDGGDHLATLDEIENFLNDYAKAQFLKQARAATAKSPKS
jgi:hypothetical protein